MSSFKRFLLLGSIGVVLLAGLMFASNTKGSSTAFASGCNSVATHSWSNNCQISEGNISNMVYAIQQLIDETGRCVPITVDGDFGPNTFNTVKCFQSYKKLSVDGIVGPQTWGTLQGLLTHETSNSGWNYWSGDGGLSHEYKMWATSGVWYVEVASNATHQLKWCQMNLSSPCNP